MAIAFVGAWTGKQNASNAGGSTAARSVTAGNFLVINTSGDLNPPGTVTTSVTDTVAQANPSTGNTGDFIRQQYVVSAVGGASVTIGIAHTSPHFSAITAAEYSGLDPSAPLDQHSVAGTGSGSTLTSASVTTTVNDELIITHGTILAATDNAWAAGASNTIRSQTNLDSVSSCTFVQERIVASTGTYSATATKSPGSGSWIMGIATYKAASGGGGAPSPPPETLLRRRPVIVTRRSRTTQTEAPAVVFIPQSRTRRVVGLFTRRSHVTSYVPTAPSTPVTPQPARRRVAWLITRRSRWTNFIQPPVVIPPPAYVPNPPRRRVAWVFTRRSHGTLTTPPPPAPPPPPSFIPQPQVKRMWKWPRPGRARGAMVAPKATAPYVAQQPQIRRKPLLPLRRGRITSAPVVPPVVVQPKFIPPGRGRQWRKPLTWLRSRFTTTPVVPPVVVPVVVVQRYHEWFKFDVDEWFVFPADEPATESTDEWFVFNVDEFHKFDIDDD